MDSVRKKEPLLFHHHHRQIPEEILFEEILFEEILPRLPVKSLLRFRCVSKSWLSLIESDRFIKTQYQNSRKNPSWAHHRVVLSPRLHENTGKLEDCSLGRLMRLNEDEGSSSIDDGTTVRKECIAVGCYNGVVCLFDYARSSFLLWNPSTRNYSHLPTRGGGYLLSKYGFGWDQSRGAYKVFAVFLRRRGADITPKVYSSETNSWKAATGMETAAYNCSAGSGLFAGGSLHWFQYGQHDIESFDLEREAFARIELPPSAAKGPPELGWSWFHMGEIGGSLSILSLDYERKSSEVWVMKEHGVKDSWFKLLTFPRENIMSMYYVLSSRLEEGPNGEIFLVSKAGFTVYSPKDATTRTAAIHGIRSGTDTAHVYVESLVSPRRRRRRSSSAKGSMSYSHLINI